MLKNTFRFFSGFYKIIDFLFDAPPADAPGTPYGPAGPIGSYPFQPPPVRERVPPKTIGPDTPPGSVGPENAKYKISNLVATYRRVAMSSPHHVINENAKYVNIPGKIIQGPIGHLTVPESHGGNPWVNCIVWRPPPDSGVIDVIYLDSLDVYWNANHYLKSFSYQIEKVESEEPDPSPDPPPYFFPPNSPGPLAPPSTDNDTRTKPPYSPLPKNPLPIGQSSNFTPPQTSPGPSLSPNPSPNPSPPSSLAPSPPTTNPTNPGTSPKPGERENTPPSFSPFPIINPQNPTIGQPRQENPPVINTPGGGGCCTSPGVTQANNSLDAIKLTLEGLDLTLLNVINTKLGPQMNGGISGYLSDRFTKLWKSRTIDRALNLMATAAAIHNAVMLSRNIGSTLIATLGNALSIIGIKDGDEVAQNFSTVIGNSIENIVKGLIGNDNYTALSETWAKANRIYQSAINIYQLMTDSLFGITSGLEQTAKYTGKIGNALRKSGVVLENSYNWMSETFSFHSGKNRKIDRVIQGLQNANEIASDLESITSEFRSVTENIREIGTEVNKIKTEVNDKESEKNTQETQGKNSSQSPPINKTDLTKPS
ncbi:hypothetical protein PN470_10895 [Microcystis sp. CS-574]|uniref:hypothetical protein n=1 Tax=Microcystis sp. CS-574 TaxID=3021718 RepID=UPI0023307E79|nr:hypothetical protein [Microcystis sp. CS-574]MDB9404782.1 hypothetical protein [Microcystis sp. CS-574]